MPINHYKGSGAAVTVNGRTVKQKPSLHTGNFANDLAPATDGPPFDLTPGS